MGIARLLAKGWLVFCVFAGAHAFAHAGFGLQAVLPVAIPVVLFAAMGELFIAGFGLSSGHLLSRLLPLRIAPGFDGVVFTTFLALSFGIQVAPHHISGGLLDALQRAVDFFVPSQRFLETRLVRCHLNGAQAFSFAASWLLAFISLGSALSRVRMAAALIRLERKRQIEPFGPSGIALVLGILSVAGIQLLFVGSLLRWPSCDSLREISGAVLIGAAPLMLAYLVAAAVANLLATNPEA
ncbi:MAG: hypothetical protein JO208_10685 [Alphaproteobacteria bacterium]|nr:hypothetical protein [Alphaproteobacteria bacterium]